MFIVSRSSFLSISSIGIKQIDLQFGSVKIFLQQARISATIVQELRLGCLGSYHHSQHFLRTKAGTFVKFPPRPTIPSRTWTVEVNTIAPLGGKGDSPNMDDWIWIGKHSHRSRTQVSKGQKGRSQPFYGIALQVPTGMLYATDLHLDKMCMFIFQMEGWSTEFIFWRDRVMPWS